MANVVNVATATALIMAAIETGIVPFMTGSPGIGKSSIYHSIAERGKLKVIDLRLSQCDPTDLNGYPTIVNGKACYLPFDTIPIMGDKVPEGHNGWMLLLDEFNSANAEVQAASYKLVLDRMVGNHKIHPKVYVVCAGNLDTDNAIVNPMSSALYSRLMHLTLETDLKGWLQWANANQIDHRICSFLQFSPDNFYTFKADQIEDTYACPRTWKFASDLMKHVGDGYPHIRPLLAGTISPGVSAAFLTFCNIYKGLPSKAALLASPETVPLSDSPSTLFALTGFISSIADETNLEKLGKFIDRMPMEFQAVTWRSMNVRNPKINQSLVFQKWALKNGKELWG